MMKIWGMLSPEDERLGFDLVLDDNWFVLLTKKSEVVARLDPRDYVATELHHEVEALLLKLRGDPKRV